MEIFIQYWQPALFSFVLGVALVLLALKVFPKIGLMDRPHLYGIERKPIPYYGGILIFITFLVSVLAFVPLTMSVVGLLFGAGVIFLIGFLDDLFRLKPWIRMIFQFIAAWILVYSGIGVLSINLPVFGVLEFGALASAFTVVWVLSIVNAMNFVDGVSGLNSGVTFIAGLTLFVLSIHPEVHSDPASQVGVATISLILAMTALSFLVFDFTKPKILMGDSGSTLFGFILATLAIFSGGKVATAFLVLGIVILDMVWVVLRRTFSGQKFWKGDLKHLHHRLMDIGFSQRKVLLMYFLLTAVFGLSAVSFVSTDQKFFIAIALVVLMLLLAAALIFVPRKK